MMNMQVRAAIGLMAVIAMATCAEAGSKKNCSSCSRGAGHQYSAGGYAPAGNWGYAGYSSPYAGASFGVQAGWPNYGWANPGWGAGTYGPNFGLSGPVVPLVAPGDELVW